MSWYIHNPKIFAISRILKHEFAATSLVSCIVWRYSAQSCEHVLLRAGDGVRALGIHFARAALV